MGLDTLALLASLCFHVRVADVKFRTPHLKIWWKVDFKYLTWETSLQKPKGTNSAGTQSSPNYRNSMPNPANSSTCFSQWFPMELFGYVLPIPPSLQQPKCKVHVFLILIFSTRSFSLSEVLASCYRHLQNWGWNVKWCVWPVTCRTLKTFSLSNSKSVLYHVHWK